MQTSKKFHQKVLFRPVDTKEQKPRLLREILKERSPKEATVFLPTPEEFSKVFAPERLKLLKLVANRPELSVSEISKILERRREAVSRDIRFFDGLGLLKLEKHARSRVPKWVVQEITVKL